MLMDEKERILKLIQKLGSEKDKYFSSWIELNEIGKLAMPALIEAMKDENVSIRVNSAYRLGDIGDASAVPTLILALDDENLSVRISATTSLGTIGSSSAIPALLMAMDNDTKSVQTFAATAVKKIFDDCENTEKCQEFEDKLTETFEGLKKKYADKRKLQKMESLIAELKMKVAVRKNQLEAEKDLILIGKPRPPRKGKIFQKLRRVRNG